MVLNEPVDDGGKEVRAKVGVISFWLRYNVDEGGEVGREDGIS
jgi:hypothetical protein